MSVNAVVLSYWDAVELPYTHAETDEVLYPIKGERASVWLCSQMYEQAAQLVPKIEFICKTERLYYGTCGFVACDVDTDYHVRVEVGDHDDVEVTVPYEFIQPIVILETNGRITVKLESTDGRDPTTLVGVKDIVTEDDVAVVFNWTVSAPQLFRKLVYTTYKHRHEGQRVCEAVTDSSDGMDDE